MCLTHLNLSWGWLLSLVFQILLPSQKAVAWVSAMNDITWIVILTGPRVGWAGEVAGRRILGDMLLSFLEPLSCSSSHHPEVMMILIQDKVKKAEGRTIDAFKLWCRRILLRVPWTVRRLNQSVRKEINPEYLLEGMMLRLQYFGHVMWRANSFEKTLMLGKTEGRRRRLTEDKRVEWHHWLSGHEFEQTPGNSEGQKRDIDRKEIWTF